MLQIYKRTILPEGDFNKVVLQLYWNHTSAWVFSCKFAAYLQNIFSEEHLWTPASDRLSLTIYLIFNFFLSEAKIAKNPLSSLHWSDLILLLIVYSTYVLQLLQKLTLSLTKVTHRAVKTTLTRQTRSWHIFLIDILKNASMYWVYKIGQH